MNDQDQACEVPFIEQLRSIPKDLRVTIEIQWAEDGTPTGHRFIPVGFMSHRAADELERLASPEDEVSIPMALARSLAEGPDSLSVWELRGLLERVNP